MTQRSNRATALTVEHLEKAKHNQFEYFKW